MYRLCAMHWDIQRSSSVLEYRKEHLPLFEQVGAYFLRLEAGELALVDAEDCQQMWASGDAGQAKGTLRAKS